MVNHNENNPRFRSPQTSSYLWQIKVHSESIENEFRAQGHEVEVKFTQGNKTQAIPHRVYVGEFSIYSGTSLREVALVLQAFRRGAAMSRWKRQEQEEVERKAKQEADVERAIRQDRAREAAYRISQMPFSEVPLGDLR